MPSCGKSKLGYKLAVEFGMEFYDTDELIENKIHTSIATYINNKGEKRFREIELEEIKKIKEKRNVVIATGGGSILNYDNIENLSYNGVLLFIDRSLENLKVTDSRPLSSSYELLKEKYKQRYHLYHKYANYVIDGNEEFDIKIKKIKELLNR